MTAKMIHIVNSPPLRAGQLVHSIRPLAEILHGSALASVLRSSILLCSRSEDATVSASTNSREGS